MCVRIRPVFGESESKYRRAVHALLYDRARPAKVKLTQQRTQLLVRLQARPRHGQSQPAIHVAGQAGCQARGLVGQVDRSRVQPSASNAMQKPPRSSSESLTGVYDASVHACDEHEGRNKKYSTLLLRATPAFSTWRRVSADARRLVRA